MLDGESQGNLSANGEQIQAIVECCKRRGVTVVLIDHVKRGSENAKKRKPLQLDDVTGLEKQRTFANGFSSIEERTSILTGRFMNSG